MHFHLPCYLDTTHHQHRGRLLQVSQYGMSHYLQRTEVPLALSQEVGHSDDDEEEADQ